MKLSLEQIKNITFGALSVEEDGGAFVFKRITDEQKEIYAESNHLLKVGATSSVMLDFYTDSETLSFHYVVSAASSRSFYAFDIYVGGVMVSHVGEEEAKHFRGDVDVALGSGEKRVRVYFPCLFSADISDVTLSDGS